MVGAGSDALNVRSSVTSVSCCSLKLKLPGADSAALNVRSCVTLVSCCAMGLPLPLPSAADRARNHVSVVAVNGTPSGSAIDQRARGCGHNNSAGFAASMSAYPFGDHSRWVRRPIIGRENNPKSSRWKGFLYRRRSGISDQRRDRARRGDARLPLSGKAPASPATAKHPLDLRRAVSGLLHCQRFARLG